MGIIESGGQNADKMIVNNLGKAEVRDTTEAISALHSRGGHKYNIRTAEIDITNAETENAVLYFKYTGDHEFYIDFYGMWLGTSTNGSGGEWKLYSVRNPTAGTLVSNGTANTPINFNAGSSKTLTATILEADQVGRTFTDGDSPWLTTGGTGTGTVVVDVPGIILTKGNSIGLRYYAQPSNTSQTASFFIVGYENRLITTDVVTL